MSKYTVELRHLLTAEYDIGLEDYPIFDESYRAVLNQKITDHYMFNEIGAESPGRFKIYLNRTMNEIMPVYNQLYASALLILNPLRNNDLAESTTKENSGSSLTSSENLGTNADVNLRVGSDTPQNLLSVPDLKSNVYASNAERAENETTQQASSTQLNSGTSLDVYTRSLVGLQGLTPSAALKEYRETFLNIDMLIIEDLATCFMGVY